MFSDNTFQFAQGDKNILTALNLNIEFSKGKKWSEKYCGEVDLSVKEGKNIDSTGVVKPHYDGVPTGGNTYVEPNGYLDVKIHVGSRPLANSDELELVMAFTSFQRKFPGVQQYQKMR